jgi:hypothetical protein
MRVCKYVKPEPKKEPDMDIFCKRIDRDMNSVDRHEQDQERRRFVRREMAKIHMDGDGCIED